MNSLPVEKEKVTIGNYLALIFAMVFFSGLLQSNTWYGIFDFTTLNGSFGRMVSSVSDSSEGIKTTMAAFRGVGGNGARDGFLQAFTLMPTIMFALGVFQILDSYGALAAARKILSPLLYPLMSLPGHAGLALIASFQSSDAGAALTRQLRDSDNLSQRETDIFAMFQFSAGAPIVNFFTTGAILYTLTDGQGELVVTSPMGLAIIVMFAFKIVGANLFRLYLKIATPSIDTSKTN